MKRTQFRHRHVAGNGKSPLQWLLVVTFVLLYVNLLRVAILTHPVQHVAATPISQTIDRPMQTVTATASQPVVTLSTSAAAKPAVKPAVPNCTKASYAAPEQLDISTASGLQTVIDSPQYYQVYGNNAAQVDAQVARCAPSGSTGSSIAEFASETGYRLSWHYTYSQSGTTCKIIDESVGMHINMILPAWQPTTYADGAFAGNWQRFAASLLNHENGHVAIDQSYGAKAQTVLQTLAASDCASLQANVTSAMNDIIAQLNTANNGYDASTSHGATQGAILP